MAKSLGGALKCLQQQLPNPGMNYSNDESCTLCGCQCAVVLASGGDVRYISGYEMIRTSVVIELANSKWRHNCHTPEIGTVRHITVQVKQGLIELQITDMKKTAFTNNDLLCLCNSMY